MANRVSFILLLTWRHLWRFSQEPLWHHSGHLFTNNRLCHVILWNPPFPTRLWESPSQMGHALVSSGDFSLHRDSRGLFRISGWSASSSLSFTWYLINAESIYGPFPNDVHYELPKNRAPLFSCYILPPFLLLQPYHGQHDSLTVEDGLILCGEAIIVPPGERKKVLEQIHQGHLGTSKCPYRARQCIYWPGINKDIEQQVEACATCQRHWPQEPTQPLKPTPPPERPWQQLGADFMMLDGSEYLVIVDYYSKMPIVQKMPTSQCNSAKTITVLKELFGENVIPEEIWSDNGPQFASHLFAEFTKDWNIKHSTSSPRNPRSNGQAESAVKIVKGLLTHAKCSGQDPYLALLAYRSTPVDSHLRSPAEMLYQHALHTTVPQRIRHKDPYAAAECERLEEHASQSAANHDRTGCHRKAPLYAGQSVSVINNDRTLWLPATVVCAADHGSYIVKVIGGADVTFIEHFVHLGLYLKNPCPYFQ